MATEGLNFIVYSPGVFACVARILRLGDLAEIYCIWVLWFDTSWYDDESAVE